MRELAPKALGAPTSYYYNRKLTYSGSNDLQAYSGYFTGEDIVWWTRSVVPKSIVANCSWCTKGTQRTNAKETVMALMQCMFDVGIFQNKNEWQVSDIQHGDLTIEAVSAAGKMVPCYSGHHHIN